MAINKYDSVSIATKSLREKGFTNSFELENGKMKNTDSGKSYTPDEMEVIEYHRFEGPSNPGDMSIVFAVECEDGAKGLVVSSYGTYSDEDLDKFMDEVPIRDRSKAVDG